MVPTESVYLAALAKEENQRTQRDKNVIELWKLNQKAFTDLILSCDHTTPQGKIAFRLIKNSRSKDYPEGNSKVAWDRYRAKYNSKSLPSLLKKKKRFDNSRLESVETDPDDWISELEGLTIKIESIDAE